MASPSISTPSFLPSPSHSPLPTTKPFLSFPGHKAQSKFLSPSSLSSTSRRPKRSVITMVIPVFKGNAFKEPPPDLASYMYHNRIVYLDAALTPYTTKMIMTQFFYLAQKDEEKPIYFYINSVGTHEAVLGAEEEALSIYDVMNIIKPPVHTLALGNVYGEAAFLLSAGAKGHRAALPSTSIMMREPMWVLAGEKVEIDIERNLFKSAREDILNLFSLNTGKPREVIEADIRHPKYFTPTEAIEYGLIDKILYNEKKVRDRGVAAEVKKPLTKVDIDV